MKLVLGLEEQKEKLRPIVNLSASLKSVTCGFPGTACFSLELG